MQPAMVRVESGAADAPEKVGSGHDSWCQTTIVRFRLILRGQVLPPDKRGKVDIKHAIRRELHPQLRNLWRDHGVLKHAFVPPIPPYPGERQPTPIEGVANKFERYGFRFVPLVREGMACELNILIMRRDSPHSLFTGSGDIDGRVKTLFDALRMPSQQSELGGNTPQEDEDPFYCLLEDDRYIYDYSVTTDRLLAPVGPDENENAVVAIIGVHLKTKDGVEFAYLSEADLY